MDYCYACFTPRIENICMCQYRCCCDMIRCWSNYDQTKFVGMFLQKLHSNQIPVSYIRILHNCIQYNCQILFDYLLSTNNYNLNGIYKYFNWTLLMTSVTYKRYDILRILLEKKCNPNIQNYHGKTILFFNGSAFPDRTNQKHYEILFTTNCNPFIKDTKGKTAKDYIKDKDMKELFDKYEVDYTNRENRTTSLYDLLVK